MQVQSLFLSSALLFGAAFFLTGCDKDVTNDPAYAFSGVVGTWRAKKPLQLVKSGDNIIVTDRDFGEQLVATLPVGTEVRIERLIRYSTEAGYFRRITGTVASGPHSGQGVLIDDVLFTPNQFNRPGYSTKNPPKGWTFRWAVAPDKLEK
jgi:hypothetical protein